MSMYIQYQHQHQQHLHQDYCEPSHDHALTRAHTSIHMYRHTNSITHSYSDKHTTTLTTQTKTNSPRCYLSPCMRRSQPAPLLGNYFQTNFYTHAHTIDYTHIHTCIYLFAVCRKLARRSMFETPINLQLEVNSLQFFPTAATLFSMIRC